jgi:hypothetical protein
MAFDFYCWRLLRTLTGGQLHLGVQRAACSLRGGKDVYQCTTRGAETGETWGLRFAHLLAESQKSSMTPWWGHRPLLLFRALSEALCEIGTGTATYKEGRVMGIRGVARSKSRSESQQPSDHQMLDTVHSAPV